MEEYVRGLIVLAMILYCWYRIKRPRTTVEVPFEALDSGPGFGARRPYVACGGELREVLHRRNLGDKVECTLRPQVRGGPRTKVTVPKDGVIWTEKGRSR